MVINRQLKLYIYIYNKGIFLYMIEFKYLLLIITTTKRKKKKQL